MKYCINCGKGISDHASFCEHCGAKQIQSSSAANTNQRKEASSNNSNAAPGSVPQQHRVTPPVTVIHESKQSQPSAQNKKEPSQAMAIFAFVLSFVFFACPISIALAIAYLAQHGKRRKGLAVAAIIISGLFLPFFLFMMAYFVRSVPEDSVSPAPNSVEVSSDESVSVETTTQNADETEKIYKETCIEVAYKDLLRSPGNYEGKNIVVTIKLSQKMSDTTWRGETDNSGEGYYWDDEYYISDIRLDKELNLLVDDIVTVYGSFDGISTLKRSITKEKVDVPHINALYIDLLGSAEDESVSASEIEKNADQIISNFDVREFPCVNDYSNQYFIVVKNTSDFDLEIGLNIRLLDSEGKLVNADTAKEYCVESGFSTVFRFNTDAPVSSSEKVFTISKPSFYKAASSSLNIVEETISDGKLFVTVRNDTDTMVSSARVYALFFLNGECVGDDQQNVNMFDGVAPGSEYTLELNDYSVDSFDSYELIVEGTNY